METRRLKTVRLDDSERTQVADLVHGLLRGRPAVPVDELLDVAALAASELPKRMKEVFYEYRRQEQDVGIAVRGNPFEGEAPSTPLSYRLAGEEETAMPGDVVHVLYSTLLGDPFAWSTIQNGYLLNDIFPIPENEVLPISSGSRNAFDLHTEDAFSPLAGDYLGWLCIRNPAAVGTMIAAVPDLSIAQDSWDVLFEARFVIRSNLAHKVEDSEEASAVFFGSRSEPYLRLNLNKMEAREGDLEAAHALEALTRGLRSVVARYVPEAGECFYIDNYRCVHGREAHKPLYDGTDRWLRRLYISTSIRRSRGLRDSAESRLIQL